MNLLGNKNVFAIELSKDIAAYQALAYEQNGKLKAYNSPDGSYNDFQEYYNATDA